MSGAAPAGSCSMRSHSASSARPRSLSARRSCRVLPRVEACVLDGRHNIGRCHPPRLATDQSPADERGVDWLAGRGHAGCGRPSGCAGSRRRSSRPPTSSLGSKNGRGAPDVGVDGQGVGGCSQSGRHPVGSPTVFDGHAADLGGAAEPGGCRGGAGSAAAGAGGFHGRRSSGRSCTSSRSPLLSHAGCLRGTKSSSWSSRTRSSPRSG